MFLMNCIKIEVFLDHVYNFVTDATSVVLSLSKKDNS